MNPLSFLQKIFIDYNLNLQFFGDSKKGKNPCQGHIALEYKGKSIVSDENFEFTLAL